MPVDESDWNRVWHDLYGNGKPGLVADVRDVKRALFKNDDTGSQGLVADVSEIKKLVQQAGGGWKAIGGLLILIEALRAFGVIP